MRIAGNGAIGPAVGVMVAAGIGVGVRVGVGVNVGGMIFVGVGEAGMGLASETAVSATAVGR